MPPPPGVPCRLRGSGLLPSPLSSFPSSPRGTAGLGACRRCGSTVCVGAGRGDSAAGRPQPRTGRSAPVPSRGAWAGCCCVSAGQPAGSPSGQPPVEVAPCEGVAFQWSLLLSSVGPWTLLAGELQGSALGWREPQRHRNQAGADQIAEGTCRSSLYSFRFWLLTF